MRLERHRSLPDWVAAALEGWLPSAEMAISLREHLAGALVVVDAGTVVAVGGLVEGRGTLSGAEVLLACAGDGRGASQLAVAAQEELGRTGRLEVAGPADITHKVVESLAERTGGTVSQVMGQRLMVATAAGPPQQVPGHARRVWDGDHALVGQWLDDFAVEALGHERRGTKHWAKVLAEADWMPWLWEVEGRSVALANARRTTAASSRIGPVYTPPLERGQGFGSAVTAAVTDACLTLGDERVTLFTDVTNATSNALYARIGFQDVCAHGSWLVEA